jgi:hypothetical protein
VAQRLPISLAAFKTVKPSPVFSENASQAHNTRTKWWNNSMFLNMVHNLGEYFY